MMHSALGPPIMGCTCIHYLSVVQNCFHLVLILVQLLLLLSSSPLLGSLTPLRIVTPCIISTWVQPTRTCWGWRGH